MFAELPAKDAAPARSTISPTACASTRLAILYVAHYGMKQVQVLDPSGKLIRQYDGGNVTTSNVAFGGPKMDQLFITGGIGPEAGEGGLFRIDSGRQRSRHSSASQVIVAKTILGIGAHYDDCVFGISGTLLKAVRKNYRVVILSLIGDYSNWKPVEARDRELVPGSIELAKQYGVEMRFLELRQHALRSE